MATEAQRREIVTALREARAARDRGDDARPLFAAAEGLMRKYGAAEEPPEEGDDRPLTESETVRLRDLMIRAAENDDAESLKRLQSLAGDPAGVRELFAQFPAAA